MSTFQLSDFDYYLPEERIAQIPAEPRDSSRLLSLARQSGQMEDKIFSDIVSMLTDNDVLVVNETTVINARLKGYIQATEKQCEIFLHKQLSEDTWDCLVYPGRKLKVGTEVIFQNSKIQPHSLEKGEDGGESSILSAIIIGISEKGRIVRFSQSGQDFLRTLEKIGETPLPPYIKNSESSKERYQTVYHDSQKSGSVAAPTAGLHFTEALIEQLKRKGVSFEKVCLHVGLGTFANVEVEDIREHHMHTEEIYISTETAERLNQYKKQGKRIIAVGTTSVRTLESFSDEYGHLGHGRKDTNIFIYPGYKWKFVDSIITNFHLPKSTLLMLVSSFAGRENIQKAYEHAVDSKYRFFSFGDAMWIY